MFRKEMFKIKIIKVLFIKLLKRRGFFIARSSYNNKMLLEKKIIFIHVPKAAGNGVLKSLGIKTPGHIHLHTYEFEDAKKCNDFYKVGFVRNPWDRIVSSFFYLKYGGMQNEYDIRMKRQLEKFDTFSEFVIEMDNNCEFKQRMLREIHFKPQLSWMVNSIGEIDMDYIGYFENLSEGFEVLKKKLNKDSAKLESHNSSKHKPFWCYYDKELVEIVARLYKNDIDTFKYVFPYEKLLDK